MSVHSVAAVLMMATCAVAASASPASSTTRDPSSSMETSEQEDDDRCNIPCPYNFNPVCGSDGTDTRMFANSCFMDRHNCEHGRGEVERVAWPDSHGQNAIANHIILCIISFSLCFSTEYRRTESNKCLESEFVDT